MAGRSGNTCVNPEVGLLLEDFKSGVLTKPGRENDGERFREHMKHCPVCFEAVLDHAQETVIIPIIKQFAEERGVSFEAMWDAFIDKVREMKREGKLKRSEFVKRGH